MSPDPEHCSGTKARAGAVRGAEGAMGTNVVDAPACKRGIVQLQPALSEATGVHGARALAAFCSSALYHHGVYSFSLLPESPRVLISVATEGSIVETVYDSSPYPQPLHLPAVAMRSTTQNTFRWKKVAATAQNPLSAGQVVSNTQFITKDQANLAWHYAKIIANATQANSTRMLPVTYRMDVPAVYRSEANMIQKSTAPTCPADVKTSPKSSLLWYQSVYGWMQKFSTLQFIRDDGWEGSTNAQRKATANPNHSPDVDPNSVANQLIRGKGVVQAAICQRALEAFNSSGLSEEVIDDDDRNDYVRLWKKIFDLVDLTDDKIVEAAQQMCIEFTWPPDLDMPPQASAFKRHQLFWWRVCEQRQVAGGPTKQPPSIKDWIVSVNWPQELIDEVKFLEILEQAQPVAGAHANQHFNARDEALTKIADLAKAMRVRSKLKKPADTHLAAQVADSRKTTKARKGGQGAAFGPGNFAGLGKRLEASKAAHLHSMEALEFLRQKSEGGALIKCHSCGQIGHKSRDPNCTKFVSQREFKASRQQENKNKARFRAEKRDFDNKGSKKANCKFFQSQKGCRAGEKCRFKHSSAPPPPAEHKRARLMQGKDGKTYSVTEYCADEDSAILDL